MTAGAFTSTSPGIHRAISLSRHYSVFVLALLVAGCIKLDQTLTIKPDASGTLDVNYSISEDAVVQAKAALKLKQQMTMESDRGPADVMDGEIGRVFLNPVEDEIRKEVGKYAKNGLKVDSLKVTTKDGWRTVKMRLSFKDLGSVAKTDFFAENGFTISKDSTGNYVLLREASGHNAYLLNPDMMQLLTPIMSGFNVVVNVVVPGKILKTSAHRTSGNTATWSYNFDRAPDALLALQSQQFSIVFESKGVSLPTITRK
jgi:hypothetical protein